MSSTAHTSPSRRPYPDDDDRPVRGSSMPSRSGRPSMPPPSPVRDSARDATRSRTSGPVSGRAAGGRRATRTGVGPASGGRLLAGAPDWLPAAAVLGGPILAAILGKFLGGYNGPVFVVLTIAAAGLATAAATPNGRWWVVPALPPVAWLVAVAADLAWHNPAYPDTKAKAVGLVDATTKVFPVILAALVVMGLVTVVAVMRDKQSGSSGGHRV